MATSSFGLRRNTLPQFDGSQWRLYQSPESMIMLTAVGRKLVAQRGISSLLHQYIQDAREGKESCADTRQYLAAGANSRVFSIRSPLDLVIKEAKPEADDPHLLQAMTRMDRLKAAVEENCPRWIDVPQHYGVLIDKATNRQFLLLQKIDHGVTASDVLNHGQAPRSNFLEAAASSVFGNITPELKSEVGGRFEKLRGLLRHSLVSQYLSPDEYLPDLDYKPDNVVLEKLEAPIAGSPIRYWVIDQ